MNKKYVVCFNDQYVESQIFNTTKDAHKFVRDLFEDEDEFDISYEILEFGDDLECLYTILYENDDITEGLFDSKYDAQKRAVEIANRDYQESFKDYHELIDSDLNYVKVLKVVL